MRDETFETLAAGYVLGALDSADLARFEGLLVEGGEPSSALVREYQEALVLLARAAPPVIPPATVKAALMARVGAERAGAAPPAPRPRWLPWAAGAVAAVALAVITGTVLSSRYDRDLERMAREADDLRARIQRQEGQLRDELAAASRVVELLRDPGTRVVALRGAGSMPEATGRVLWNDRAGGHLLVTSLAPVPPGKTYELWTITGGAPRPAGLLAADRSGRAAHRIEPLPGGEPVDVFAVTVEPAGGTPAPTGPIVLASAK